MVKHIVMWKIAEVENKSETMLEIKKELEALKGELSVIESIEVGINSGDENNFDIVLVSEFKDFAALNAYVEAPEHKAVAATLIKPNAIERRCVDYEI